jgi:chemotaxis protein methyltransferase CheR
VAFHYHNLANQPFRSPVHNLAAFDLILCRNVLIYFGPDFVESVLSQLAESLVPTGWLAVGHAEHGRHLQSDFETVSFPGAILYRKLLPGDTATLCRQPRFLNEPRLKPGRPSAVILAESFLHGAHISVAPRSAAMGAPTSGASKQLLPAESPIELQQIRALADAGNIDAALQLCGTLIASQPLNPIGYFYEALLSDLVGQHAGALRSLQKAIYLDRKFVLAHYYSGLIHEKLGHIREALTSFRNVAPLLAGRPGTEPLAEAGGLSVNDLQELTRKHVDSLEEAAAE